MPQPKRKILKDFELTEISGVDKPAQPTALMTIMKNNAPTAEHATVTLAKHYCSKGVANAKTFSRALITSKISDQLWPMTDALSTSIRSIVDSDMAEGEIPAAISESISSFSSRLLTELADVTNPLTKCVTNLLTKPEDDQMPKPTLTIEELTKKVATLTTDLTAAIELAKFNDAEKAFMTGMSDDDTSAFKALDASERKAKMDLAKSADETIVVAGEVISKNVVGSGMFAVIKSQQAELGLQNVKIAKAEEAAELITFEKRAVTEFSHVPGEANEIAAVLKALKGSPEAVRNTVDAIFKAAETMAVKAFSKVGSTTTKSGVILPEGTSAEEQLDTLAKAYSKDHKVDYSTGYAAVIELNTHLYEEALGQGN